MCAGKSPQIRRQGDQAQVKRHQILLCLWRKGSRRALPAWRLPVSRESGGRGRKMHACLTIQKDHIRIYMLITRNFNSFVRLRDRKNSVEGKMVSVGVEMGSW